MSRTLLHESTSLVEAAKPTDGPGRLRVKVIDAGTGSSGVYTEALLKQAAKDRVFHAGLHCYIDHPSESEQWERPERSIKDLAGVLATDAVFENGGLYADVKVFSAWRKPIADMAESIGMSIRAQAEVGSTDDNGRPVFSKILSAESVDFVTHAGRGGAVLSVLESARVQEARNVGQWIESRIHRDFTVLADDMAGEGRLTREERIALSSAIGDALAAFVSKIEDAAPQLYSRDLWAEPGTATAAEAAVAEASAEQRGEELRILVKDAHKAGPDEYVWLIDYDETACIALFSHETKAGVRVMRQGYTLTGDVATALTGDPVEVRRVITYEPVTEAATTAVEAVQVSESATTQTTDTTPVPAREAAPAAEPHPPAVEAGTNPPHKKEEAPMPQIPVDEARLTSLQEKAERVPALEAAKEAADKRAEAAESERDEYKRRATQAEAKAKADRFARNLIGEANKDLVPASVELILTEAMRDDLPLNEDGSLDTDKFAGVVNESRKAHETFLATVAEESGLGTVRGLGATQAAVVSEADFDKAVARAFGRKDQ
ncbi:hypothetical protein [Xylanimonas protaetiae]|uniref:Uncharacterized protein n=1 Tax=Xylanimonas protaetiae TaxID=2509457 RepID=A0A4P6F403_9MICO|nr:hypothetical protein [Xylanimonas protaetiae]QAY69995.1 hypothetical protein ET471_08090 [Xylanimonas protaetiae]